MKQKLGLAFPWAAITWLSICAKHRRSFWPVPRAPGTLAGGWCQRPAGEPPAAVTRARWLHAPGGSTTHRPVETWPRAPVRGPGTQSRQGAVNSGHRCIFKLCVLCLLSHIAYVSYFVVVPLWWGQTLHWLQCYTRTLLLLQLSEVRANALAVQLLLLRATIMAFPVT